MKRTTPLIFVGAAAILGAVVYVFYATSRFSVELARATVLRSEGPFEIRDYPDLLVARTHVDSDDKDSAFQRLFGFINGGNVRSEKIAMTAPVLTDADRTMSFILPDDDDTPPDATVEGVTLQRRPAIRVAVYRYSGASNPENEAAAIARLREWTEAEGITTVGEPTIATYDSPLIPAPLRRTEVFLAVAKS